MSTASAPTTALVTGWDRLAVIVLGGAGCALSASALMQMAIAIHIRPALCWLFPLVVDGFIAYGIRALLVLRTAPLRARLYVWTLVGTATGVSVWANALHAVRLNETARAGELQLGDSVVAYLSTVAPLALAGAVHLYILIARGPDNHRDRADRADDQRAHLGQVDRSGGIEVTPADRAGQRSPHAGQVSDGRPVTAPTHLSPVAENRQIPVTRSPAGAGGPAADGRPFSGRSDRHIPGPQAADLGGHSDSGPAVSDRPVAGEPVTTRPVSDRETRRTSDRRPDPDTEELLEIARSAVRAEDKLTRQVVSQAIRGQKIPLSSATLTTLMAQLREQRDEQVTAERD